MDIIKLLSKEMENEAETTRKMLSRIPEDRYDWQPHPKSMSIRRLATHIADVGSWVQMAVCDDELDFATSTHREPEINDNAALLDFFEKSYATGKAALDNAILEELEKPWTMRSGDHVYFTQSKFEVIRASFCQIVHHRAQLGVYLRLLDVAIPGSYGPSADEVEMYNEPEAAL
ncbi:MAG: DinB family protein [Bacteroidetes bacterium]|nr:DinB family protein [Bacteroidota bacterium]